MNYRNSPSRRSSAAASVSLALEALRSRFGPTVSIQRITDSGISGARVLLRERGEQFVLATCLSGAPEDRPLTAALWALDGVHS